MLGFSPGHLLGFNERVTGGLQGFWFHGTLDTSVHNVYIASI